MKLGLDVSAVPAKPAGAGRYVVEVARRVPALVDHVTLVSRRDDAARWNDIAPTALVAPVVPASRVARLAYEALQLGRSTAFNDSDVFHSPHYTMPRAAKRPIAVTIHDMTFFTHPEWHERTKVPFFRSSIKRAAQRASVLIAVSETTKRELVDILSPSVPVVVAPHGVDLEWFVPSQRVEGPPTLFFVGTFEPRKGLDVLLDAFEDVARDHHDVRLRLAGQAGWGTGELSERIDRHPFGSRIDRLGFISDAQLRDEMQAAAVVVYPSRGEGFGMPVLEAMACGAITVTSSDTVMQEVANDGALFARPGDATDLARAVDLALTLSPSARDERSRTARARAEEFTWDRSMALHLEAYQLANGARR